MSTFRILSLDGGGCWALLQVMALQAIYGEEAGGNEVLKEFDLVAANSGGSITLGGLLTGRTLDDILDNFYMKQEMRKKVFSPLHPFVLDAHEAKKRPFRKLWNRLLRRTAGIGAKYRTQDKLNGLRLLLMDTGDRMLKDIHRDLAENDGRAPHILICGFDYDRQRAKFFRSNTASRTSSRPENPHPPQMETESKEPLKDWRAARYATLAQAVHASSNAPVQYFMTPAIVNDVRYWDGAIAGYNNPIMAAVTEAIANGAAANEIQVLSIGTGIVSRSEIESGKSIEEQAVDKRLLNEPEDVSLLGDVGLLARAILEDPPESATFVAHVLLGNPLPEPGASRPVNGRVVRISPHLRPVRAAPDQPWHAPKGLKLNDAESDEQAFAETYDLDLDVLDQVGIERLRRLGEQWIVDRLDNQAIRENRQFECQVGFAKFSQAVDCWRKLAEESHRTAVALPLTSKAS